MGLKLEGYEVITAENGLEGLEKFSIHGADAITLDLMMPVMDGRTFIQRIRTDLCKDVPIIVLTSVDLEDATKDLTDSGASAIIIKPATVQEIATRLKEFTKITC